MNSFTTRYRTHQAQRAIDDAERQRTAFLNSPLPRILNDPALLVLTPCKVLKSFCIAGRPLVIGEHIELARHDAQSLAALGKVELL